MACPGQMSRADGKFLEVDGRRFLVKGVAYGTFAPDATGAHFPEPARLSADFTAIAAAGFNTVRTYTVPSSAILDEAARNGLRVMVGLPWSQHTAFLDDTALVRQIRRDACATVRRLASHPASLMFAIGNEIPPGIVRWHGHRRIEGFLRSLCDEVKAAAPEALLTYVNFPPTDYLDLDCFDVCAFNVYLHREADLRAYLARLQHLAGSKPLLLAEAGGDSLREGLDGQARIAAMHVRAAFAVGACGAVAFSWTDEWWRGGRQVDDWAFGLVDADRRPKPALTAVSGAFAEAPFSEHERRRWPLVSVVVCAYNAADTIDDCLASLTALSYPRVEIIVVNDGSNDATAANARGHADVRVIDALHSGLSAARNAGLASARGEIVAYTDADVRVDPDWLTYLVQPLLDREIAGVGGPNVVPPDDPWMAQCVSRAPGGPTHVLLDDRIAEHVPGCNMAFRRDALLAVSGFNPVFLRAGDDVDVCWRLQARGLRIGFAPGAVVWHHHRTTIEAFWRQQAGYGEAETWLYEHHPDKFSRGRMLWHGRIYSSLPFVRALKGRRVNTGRWGTAAFPSVYWVGGSAWHFLPLTVEWMVTSSTLLAAGMFSLPGLPGLLGQAGWVLLAGAAGWLVTLIRCLTLAHRSDLRGLPPIGRLSPTPSRAAYRVTIAWLHVVQPLARMRGRLRGLWSMPPVGEVEAVRQQPWQVPQPSLSDARGSGRLLAGLAAERSFWSERWLSHAFLLSGLTAVLRKALPAQTVEVDDGWHADRDLCLAVGRWGHLDVRMLVEDHAEGRCLVRVGTRLRFRPVSVAIGVGLAGLIATGGAAAVSGWRSAGLAMLATAAAFLTRAVWRAAGSMAVLNHGLSRVVDGAALLPLAGHSTAHARVPRGWRPVTAARMFQTAVVITVVALGLGRFSGANDTSTQADAPTVDAGLSDVALFGGGGIAVGLAGDVFVAEAQPGLIRRLRPRPPAGAFWSAGDIGAGGDPLLGTRIPVEAAADIALAQNGDLFVADARRHRIRRVVPSTGEAATIAGSTAAGFDGDDGVALSASLHSPSALAVALNGDLYIADTLNNRVRMVASATGVITTVAGDGRVGDGSDVGDGEQATLAQLDHPMGLAVASNGDLYIADTGHHRVREVSAETGRIMTIAGDGTEGREGDGGPAARARLASPMGLAIASSDQGTVLYVADSRNYRVRVVDPDGAITTLAGSIPIVAPTRIAYHPAGWLYVKDGSQAGVTALTVPRWQTVAWAGAPDRQDGSE